MLRRAHLWLRFGTIRSVVKSVDGGVGHKPTGLTVEYDESGELLLGVKII